MAVNLDSSFLLFRIVVGHAPHLEGNEPEFRAWWDYLGTFMDCGGDEVLLMDVNSRLGSQTFQSVSDGVFAEKENSLFPGVPVVRSTAVDRLSAPTSGRCVPKSGQQPLEDLIQMRRRHNLMSWVLRPL